MECPLGETVMSMDRIEETLMLLQDKRTGSLIEVVEIVDLVNPTKDKISGRVQSGQEEQDKEPIAKETLIFPSGEDLPRCWVDANYREPNTTGA